MTLAPTRYAFCEPGVVINVDDRRGAHQLRFDGEGKPIGPLGDDHHGISEANGGPFRAGKATRGNVGKGDHIFLGQFTRILAKLT